MTKINYLGKCLLIETNNKNDKRNRERGIGKRILVIGDLHFGYGESMRMSGIMIPDNLYKDIVKEMDLIFEHVSESYGKVDEVVLLGDLKHEFGKIMRSEWREISDFLDYLNGKCAKIIIVKGNHDAITDVVAGKKGLEIVDYYISTDIAFVHGDRKLEGSEIYDSGIRYWIMGHGHPAVRISDGVKEEKYKCFLVGEYKVKKEDRGERIKKIWEKDEKEVIIVPSFFSVNEGTDARDFDLGMAWVFDLMKFKVKVVQEDEVEALDFGPLEKLKS